MTEQSAPQRSGKFVWDRTSDEGNVLDAARGRMEVVFDDFDEVVVSFSGGKDSTAVLNLAAEVAERRGRLPLRVIHFDEEALAPDTVDYVRRTYNDPRFAVEWYCVPIQHRDGATSGDGFWHPWAPEHEELWTRPMPPEGITLDKFQPLIGEVSFDDPLSRPSVPDLLPYLTDPAKGRTAMLLGIRADESLVRLKAVSFAGRAYAWQVVVNAWITKCYPIYDWRTADVWRAPHVLGWDYNRFYDILEMAGVPHHLQRCAPPFGDEPIRDLHIWQETYPELWDRMVARVPGAAAAARYANTELYSAFDQFTLAPGQSPETVIREIIDGHDASMAKAGAKAVRYLMGLHYRRTTEPILLNAKHPVSGLSWRMLRKAAQTGDLKNRIKGQMEPGASQYDANRRRYLAEYDALIAAGHTWLTGTVNREGDSDE